MSDPPSPSTSPHPPNIRVWYRSLYWRIAFGLVGFLALMLAAQGLLFIFLTNRFAGAMPARSSRELAVVVAADLGATLTLDPFTDIPQYVHDQYDHVFQPIVVAMNDGQTASNRENLVPAGLEALMRRQAMVLDPFDPLLPPIPGEGGPPRPGPGGFRPRLGLGPDSGQMLAGARAIADFQPVLVNGERVGLVAVPLARPPFALLVRELGPTMGPAGGTILVVGGTLMAFVVFGPARRRLSHLQAATERIGAGDLAARAPEHGGDEVAALAHSFNRMAQELATRARALEISDQARRQLLADVSHELMTPLTAMRGYIETLSMPELALDSSTRDRYLRIVDEETQRLEHIIGDLLELARLEGGGPSMRKETVSIARLFDRVATRHERELQQHAIALRQDIAAGADTGEGDPDRLEQALQNLVANALRHTPDGGEIALRSSRRDRTIVLTVRDNGTGIPAEHLPLIFDRFYKVDSSRRAVAGSGLGLSIVKAIVERHGGTITARNDGGAVFEITLPLP